MIADRARIELGARLALIAAIVLLPALLFARHILCGELFSAADVRGDMLPFRSEGFPPSRNWHLTDVATQFEPWDRFTSQELAAGRAPLWNPRTGSGAPHLGNAQSAAVAPTTALVALLGPRAGPMARAYLRVVIALAGMTIFLRGLGCGRFAALFGGLAFAFGGHELLWLGWPQSGVSAWLPCLCHLARRAAEGDPLRPGARAAAPLLLLAPVVALVLSGGHPETAFAIVLGAAVYLAYALACAPAISRGERIFRLIAFAAMGALGALLAGAALLPFLDYLRGSDALSGRSAGMSRGLKLLEAIDLFAPTFLGHPVDHTEWSGAMLLGAGGGYVGLAPLVLALVPTRVAALARERRFMAGLLVFSLAAAYGVPPVSWLLERAPVLRLARDEILLVWFAFAAATLGAIGLDALLRAEAPPGFTRTAWFRGTVGAISVAVVLLLGIGVGALHRFLLVDEALGRPPGSPDLRPQGEIIAACALSIIVAAMIVTATIVIARNARRSWVFGAVILALEAADAGFLAHERYLPRTPIAQAERRSESLDALAASTHGRALLLGKWTARPNLAADAGIADPRIYDALLLEHYGHFEAALGPALGPLQAFETFHEPFLDLLSIDRIATPWDRDLGSEEVPRIGLATEKMVLEPGRKIEVALGSPDFEVVGVTLHLGGTRGDERLSLTLRDGPEMLAAREVPARYALPGWPFVIPFSSRKARAATAADAPLTLVIEAMGGPVTLLGGPDGRPAIGLRRQIPCAFPLIEEGALRVHANPRALPPAFVVPRATWVRGRDVAIEMLASGACDPRAEALLDGDGPAMMQAPGGIPATGTADPITATIVDRHPGFARISLPERIRGVLIVSETWDAGWRASVDGAETPVRCAFGALQGIVLPDGAREVVLRYEPESWRVGVLASIAGAAIWLGLVVIVIVLRRSTAPHGNPARASDNRLSA